jgi:two-component system, response regulator
MLNTEQLVDILLIEDNRDDEELCVEALRANRIANVIHVLRDGEEALEFLSCSGRYAHLDLVSKAPRVILLDLKLPKVSGLEILKLVKADPRLRVVPMVVLTSSREERDIVESYKLGVNSYIVKPVTFEQFAEAVRLVGMYWVLLNQPPVVRNAG